MQVKLIILILVLGVCVHVPAQPANQGRFSVTVLNEKNEPLENATIELLKSNDSTLAKVSLTDKNGVAEFEKIIYGSYLLKTSATNYTTTFSNAFIFSLETSGVKLPDIRLLPGSTQLGEVVVSARKPFIQKLNDRIVVNVDNSIVSAGSTALEVLARSPGVSVDQDDVISLKGRQGVIIMIDGKPTPMTGADLANYLRGLPSAVIERIDLITNPSAKYDASGKAGIIDIRMKKDQRLGANGTMTAGYGQGIYPKANAGTTFNYRNKKINVFGNYNFSYRENLNHLILDRSFYDNGVYHGGDLKDNYAKLPFKAHTARFGVDYFLDNKTIIGVVTNGSFYHFDRSASNNSIVIDDQHKESSTFQTASSNNDGSNNIVANVNLKHTFDSTGRELTADIDYGVYTSGSLSRSSTKYYHLDGSMLQPDYILDGDQDGKLKFKTVKADYVLPFKKGVKLETGFKTSFVSSDNDAKFFDVSTGTPQKDAGKTNHFFYKENNNAVYFNVSKEFKKFNIQVGLRGEQTNVKTTQAIGNVQWDSSYL